MKQPKKILIAQHNIEGQFPVLWYRTGRTHLVTYGAQVDSTSNSMRAVYLFGEAVRHQAECAGRLDYDSG